MFSFFAIFGLALFTLVWISFRSIAADNLLSEDEKEELTLKPKTALMIPLVGSIMLMLMFFFLSWFSFLMFIFSIIGAITGIAWMIMPLIEMISVERKNILGTAVSIFVVCVWAITGNEWFSNVIAMGLAVMSGSFMRLPNLKVAVLLLTGLFFYDIFWVFYSADIFGSNVMVKVATTEAANPIQNIAVHVLPTTITKHIVETVQLPMKLMVSGHLLGLGDIVVPSLVTSFVLRVDQKMNRRRYSGLHEHQIPSKVPYYFTVSVVGWSVGLFLAILMSSMFEMAQPALLYLVPCVLGFVFVAARIRSELSILWNWKLNESQSKQVDDNAGLFPTSELSNV